MNLWNLNAPYTEIGTGILIPVNQMACQKIFIISRSTAVHLANRYAPEHKSAGFGKLIQ